MYQCHVASTHKTFKLQSNDGELFDSDSSLHESLKHTFFKLRFWIIWVIESAVQTVRKPMLHTTSAHSQSLLICTKFSHLKIKNFILRKKKEKKKIKRATVSMEKHVHFLKMNCAILWTRAHTSTLWTRQMTRATVKQQQVQLQQQSHHSDWFRNRTSPACRCSFPFVISTVFFIFSMSQMSTIFRQSSILTFRISNCLSSIVPKLSLASLVHRNSNSGPAHARRWRLEEDEKSRKKKKKLDKIWKRGEREKC